MTPSALPADIEQLPLLDMQGEPFLTDPHSVFRTLREQSPLVRTRRGIEVLRYDWVLDLYSDRRFETPAVADFVAKGAPPVFRAFLEYGFLLGFQGDRHDHVRRILQKGFTIRRVEALRAIMRDVANALVDRFIDLGEADFVARYTTHFPVLVICRLLGVPDEDISQFQDASSVLHLMGAVPIAPGYPQIEAGLTILRDYVAHLVRHRRIAPGEDFVSDLLDAEASEGKLTEEELIWNIANLLFAAQDTTRFQLAAILHGVVTASGNVWERLAAAPELATKVTQEGIRFYPAAHWNSRRACDDLTFRGYPFRKGQWVFLSNMAAGRDPAAFRNPDQYDIDRTEPFATGFGRGMHNCVGQLLARSGMEESLRVLSRRLTHIDIAGEVRYVKPTSMVGGPETLPMAFRAR